jgi:phage shock protein PspC (stress-responsive transcriptional regulator)
MTTIGAFPDPNSGCLRVAPAPVRVEPGLFPIPRRALRTKTYAMSTFGDTTQSDTPAGPVSRPPLRRAYHGRMLAGVCAGIADYLAVDTTIVRIAFVVFTFLGGAGIPAYLACLLLIPEEGSDQSIAGSLLDSIR